VIAILAALLLPALSKTKDKAKSIQCLHNTRQITLSYKMTLDDGGGALGSSSILDWVLYETGIPQKGWICPSAPLPPRSQQTAVYIAGKVNSAWVDPGWDSYARWA